MDESGSRAVAVPHRFVRLHCWSQAGPELSGSTVIACEDEWAFIRTRKRGATWPQKRAKRRPVAEWVICICGLSFGRRGDKLSSTCVGSLLSGCFPALLSEALRLLQDGSPIWER